MKKIKVKVLVLGAGVGGLGAGCWLKSLGENDFKIVDKCTEVPKNLHNGVHYLHSIPDLPFEMDFKKVTLTDGVLDAKTTSTRGDVAINYSNYEIRHKPNLMDMLKYSEKVREIQHPSSIMEVGKRPYVFLPKSNTMNEMIENMEHYIGSDKFMMNASLKVLNSDLKWIEVYDGEVEEVVRIYYDKCISTLPLSLVEGEFGFNFKLDANPVHICNAKVDKIVPNWMINLYVPDSDTPMYRGSLLNNLISIESTHLMNDDEVEGALNLLSIFHIDKESVQTYTWETGKVMSISIDDREQLVNEMEKKDFYSIGRFGLWNRKLLVDSTIKQAELVAKYINHKEPWDAIISRLIK